MKPNALTVCTNKKLYISKEEAELTAVYLWKKKELDLRTYHCTICQGWHLTSKK